MPQMAPMNWMSLFIMFTVVFLIFNTLNYFCFLYTPKYLKLKKNLSLITWKW